MILNDLIAKTKNNAFLYVMKGDILSEEGERSYALLSFQSALRKNPLMTGAIIDLGMTYYTSYHTDKAWVCFNIARNIYPLNHTMLLKVNYIENNLELTYPELF